MPGRWMLGSGERILVHGEPVDGQRTSCCMDDPIVLFRGHSKNVSAQEGVYWLQGIPSKSYMWNVFLTRHSIGLLEGQHSLSIMWPFTFMAIMAVGVELPRYSGSLVRI